MYDSLEPNSNLGIEDRNTKTLPTLVKPFEYIYRDQ